MSSTYERAKSVIMNTYSRFPIVFESGEGMYLSDENGKKYLDFVAGIAVNCLGHSDKGLAEEIARQAGTLIHCSNLYWTKPQVGLAEKLVNNSCFDKVFFCNSGAEAVEGAIKLARKYGKGRYEIISMANSFHGRTMGAVTATGQEKYHKHFAPLLPGIKYADFNDFASLENAISENTCAVLIEPVQGEGGIRPATPEYLRNVRSLCDEKDILLIFDEVQCGIGRAGELFAYQYYGIEPDVAVIAKGLGGGFPIGAVLAKAKQDVLEPGEHASTFGGNPLATSAANYVLDRLLGGLCDNVKKRGNYLSKKLHGLKNMFEAVIDVRGVGLMQGIELSVPVAPIISKCIEGGLLLVGSGANVIRFVPAFIVTENDIDKAMAILSEAMSN